MAADPAGWPTGCSHQTVPRLLSDRWLSLEQAFFFPDPEMIAAAIPDSGEGLSSGPSRGFRERPPTIIRRGCPADPSPSPRRGRRHGPAVERVHAAIREGEEIDPVHRQTPEDSGRLKDILGTFPANHLADNDRPSSSFPGAISSKTASSPSYFLKKTPDRTKDRDVKRTRRFLPSCTKPGASSRRMIALSKQSSPERRSIPVLWGRRH